ncbi:protocadherin alpha-2-like isoform X1 [Chiroxiphia lanceolata]|uniref:protocadherin alpha-2-like isoform X1 n=2 Tax=Chiroxiphia lanceolata TaxID=296741 RepID=UPI0013CF06C6|nr:protocadherin alpha-2-like isoform X1 [Chiroxiphia lanceolata]
MWGAAESRAGPRRGPEAAAMGDRVWGAVLRVVAVQAAWALCSGQVRYSVPEEAKAGTVVGRVAQDVGLEAGEAEARRLRLVSAGRRASVEVSGASGALVVSSRLDREELCGKSAPCALRLEVLVERPLRVFHVELEVTDINDNAPSFRVNEEALNIPESSLVGSRFPLEGASDADIGANAQLSYTLSPSEHFRLEQRGNNDEGASLGLIVTKPLDRETMPVHRLLLTASDGGRPSLTGTMEVVISVLDVNDNAPKFNQSVYKVKVLEGSELGTLLITLSATDPDEGINSDIIYLFGRHVTTEVKEMFTIDENKGEIRLQGKLDYEEMNSYEIPVEARDKGSPPWSGHCKVLLEVLDVNDNAPEVRVTSLSVPVAEDASLGTVVALLSVWDRDSGSNGDVRCWVWPSGPFVLEATLSGSYSLVLREALDRERVSEYEVEVRAEDGGSPSLGGRVGLRVPVSDVNDNAPSFAQAVYTVLARENNLAGAELARLWARDPDEAGNGRVSYSLWEGALGGGSGWWGSGWAGGVSASSYVSVEAESGVLRALQPLDYEEVQVLQFEVRAVDAGEPALCGNATVQLFVLDENDNAPALLPAAGGGAEAGSGSGEAGTLWAWAAWGSPSGQVVAKIRAVDADSGYNAWLRYELWEPRGKSALFRVGLYSGEVSTARALEEADGPRQRLVIVVRDHGEPARSATATLSVSLVEGGEAALAAAAGSSSLLPRSLAGGESGSGPAALASSATNVWLVVAICGVSSVFLLAVVLYGASRWAPRAAVLSGPGPTTLVCASEVGSWSYSQRHSRSLCVADGAAKSDLMVFSPNFPPPPGAASENGSAGTGPSLSPLTSIMPKHPNPDWRYSASLRAGMQSAVHMEEAAVLRGGPGGPDQQWPTVSSATAEPEAGEVSPPVGAGVNSNSWTFKFGPGNSKQGGPGELPDKFIIPGSPAIISIRQEPPNSQIDKSDFITFGKKEETKKKKKKKKGNKTQEKKEKGNSTTENSDQ